MNTGRRCVAIVAIGTALAGVTATTQVRPRFDLADVHASAVNRSAAPPTMQGNVVRDGVYRIQNATMVDLIRTANQAANGANRCMQHHHVAGLQTQPAEVGAQVIA